MRPETLRCCRKPTKDQIMKRMKTICETEGLQVRQAKSAIQLPDCLSFPSLSSSSLLS